jgi:signal transduction histidine kinase
LKEEVSAVHATITDDGRGFDIQALQKATTQDRGSGPENGSGLERGLGLIGMQERAVLLDGSLEITSYPGLGTTVEVRIPLDEHVPDLPTQQATSETAVQAEHMISRTAHEDTYSTSR